MLKPTHKHFFVCFDYHAVHPCLTFQEPNLDPCPLNLFRGVPLSRLFLSFATLLSSLDCLHIKCWIYLATLPAQADISCSHHPICNDCNHCRYKRYDSGFSDCFLCSRTRDYMFERLKFAHRLDDDRSLSDRCMLWYGQIATAVGFN